MKDNENIVNRAIKDQLLTLWSIQDSLLQSYRGIFLSSQSIIFSIAAIIPSFNGSSQLTFIPLIILGCFILKYWIDICTARELDVSFCQMELLKLEKQEPDSSVDFMSNFKKWQKFSHEQKRGILREFGLSESLTRIKMSNRLPFLFASLWIIMALFMLFKNGAFIKSIICGCN